MKFRNKVEIELSVLIIGQDREDNVDRLLERIKQVVSKLDVSYEMIFVSQKLSAGVKNNLKELADKVFQISKGRYGDILKRGFGESRGNYIITLDGDFSQDPYFIKDMFEKRGDAEIVIGSRYIKGGYSDVSVLRKVSSLFLNKIFSFVLSLPIKDISSGFRLYNRKIFEGMEIESSNFDILEEIFVKSYGEGWRYLEVPFHYRPQRSIRKGVIKFPFSCLRTLFKMWKLRNSLFSADYDERAFYSRIPLQRYWQRKRYKIIMNFVERREKILDIGCGSSKILEGLPQAIGLDIQLKKLRYRRQLGRGLVNGKIQALSFLDESFDEVICSEVIEHVPMEEGIFKEMHRVLKRGGNFVIGTPDYGKLTWRIIEFFYQKILPGAYADKHISHYTNESLLELINSFGFKVKEVNYILNSEMILKAEKL